MLHFEQVADLPEEERRRGADELLDPGAVLTVLGELAKLTDGVASIRSRDDPDGKSDLRETDLKRHASQKHQDRQHLELQRGPVHGRVDHRAEPVRPRRGHVLQVPRRGT